MKNISSTVIINFIIVIIWIHSHWVKVLSSGHLLFGNFPSDIYYQELEIPNTNQTFIKLTRIAISINNEHFIKTLLPSSVDEVTEACYKPILETMITTFTKDFFEIEVWFLSQRKQISRTESQGCSHSDAAHIIHLLQSHKLSIKLHIFAMGRIIGISINLMDSSNNLNWTFIRFRRLFILKSR